MGTDPTNSQVVMGGEPAIVPPQAVPPQVAPPPIAAVPSPPSVPAAPPPVVYTEAQVHAMQVELSRSRQALAAFQQQQAQFQQAQATARWQQELQEQQGLTPEQAQAVTGRLRATEMQAEAANEAAMEMQAKPLVANQIASHFGVAINDLLSCGTPQAMVEKAQWLKERNELRSSLEALKKGLAPAQRFDQGPSGGGALSGDALAAKAASGAEMSRDEFVQLAKSLGLPLPIQRR